MTNNALYQNEHLIVSYNPSTDGHVLNMSGNDFEMIYSLGRGILSELNCENVDAMVKKINKFKPNMLEVADIVRAGVKGLHLAIVQANIEDKKRIEKHK